VELAQLLLDALGKVYLRVWEALRRLLGIEE
jgi:hypothetical protein